MKSTVSMPKELANQEPLFYSGSLKQILADFSPRSQEIIFSRFGVFGNSALTLEEIGKKYKITRERVRQIIHEVLKRIRDRKELSGFSKIEQSIVLAISSNGGIMEEKKLLNLLCKGDKTEEAALKFFLECADEVKHLETKGELKSSYCVYEFDIENWRKAKNHVLEILKSKNKPLFTDELFELANKNHLSKDVFTHYLEVSDEIRQNTFEKWGIAKWREISPKGTREKAYLILKEAAEPLHFREIAGKIDHHKLNKKKTHPQTVHNELIKDSNFVLVGRGIYALVEWGYKKGTVKDVIEEILNKSEKALTKDEVLMGVLKVRSVKKSTIIINLNNYFLKEKNGTYGLKK